MLNVITCLFLKDLFLKDLCKEFENQVKNGRLFCTRESDPVRGPDGRIHGNKCALCAEIL